MTIQPYVTFVERSGTDAEPTLRALAERLAHGGASTELLRSRDQDDLRLLVARGPADLAEADVAGARVWRFEAAGS